VEESVAGLVGERLTLAGGVSRGGSCGCDRRVFLRRGRESAELFEALGPGRFEISGALLEGGVLLEGGSELVEFFEGFGRSGDDGLVVFSIKIDLSKKGRIDLGENVPEKVPR